MVNAHQDMVALGHSFISFHVVYGASSPPALYFHLEIDVFESSLFHIILPVELPGNLNQMFLVFHFAHLFPFLV